MGIPHGTTNGYWNYECRCDLCKAAMRDHRRRRYIQANWVTLKYKVIRYWTLQTRRSPWRIPSHGTWGEYVNHCRKREGGPCDPCREAARERDRKRNRSPSPRRLVAIKRGHEARKARRRVDPTERKRVRELDKARKRAMRIRLFEVMDWTSCVRCGESLPPEKLDIDHVDPRTKSPKLRKKGWEELSQALVREEAQKCQPLCRPCHYKKSAAEHKAYFDHAFTCPDFHYLDLTL
jgi:hypothetical protein